MRLKASSLAPAVTASLLPAHLLEGMAPAMLYALRGDEARDQEVRLCRMLFDDMRKRGERERQLREFMEAWNLALSQTRKRLRRTPAMYALRDGGPCV